jgi:hypothetical protein
MYTFTPYKGLMDMNHDMTPNKPTDPGLFGVKYFNFEITQMTSKDITRVSNNTAAIRGKLQWIFEGKTNMWENDAWGGKIVKRKLRMRGHGERAIGKAQRQTTFLVFLSTSCSPSFLFLAAFCFSCHLCKAVGVSARTIQGRSARIYQIEC